MKISELKPFDKNPRRIGKEQLERLKKSLKDFEKGMVAKPILVDENNTILAGHQRIKALKQDGQTEIPDNWIKKITNLTEEEKKKLVLLDNNPEGISGEWDEDLLKDWDKDLLGDMGFDLLEEEAEAKEDDYEIPEEIKTDIKEGDLFEIKKDGKVLHRLLCGDATKVEDVEKLMGGEKADMVFTDPPFGYKYKSNHQKKHEELLNDDKILDFLPNAFLFSKENIAVYVFCGWQTITEWIKEVKNNALVLKNIIIWKKNNWSMGDLKGAYGGQYEVILFSHKGRIELKNGRGQDVWEFDREPPKEHPTKKPTELIEKAIKDTTENNALVIDFFGGSGSTMIACHQLNRRCNMMELDPRYNEIILQRLLKLDNELEVYKNGDKTEEFLKKIT